MLFVHKNVDRSQKRGSFTKIMFVHKTVDLDKNICLVNFNFSIKVERLT